MSELVVLIWRAIYFNMIFKLHKNLFSQWRDLFYQNSVKTQLIFLVLFLRYIDAIENDVFTAHKYYNVSIMAQTNYFDFTEHIKVGSILIFFSS